MAGVVNSLFGIDPQQITRQRQQTATNEALQYAQLDPFQRAHYSIYQGAHLGGRMLGGLMGAQDPELQRVQQRQQLLQGVDIGNPDSLKQAAQQAMQAGDYAAAQELAAKARELEVGAYEVQYKQSQIAKNMREGRAASDSSDVKNAKAWASSRFSEGTPEWEQAYAQKLDELITKKDPADKPMDFGDHRESVAMELYGKRFASLSPTEIAAVNKRVETEKDRRAEKGATKVGVNMLGKEPKDIPEFRAKVISTIKPYKDAVDAAETSMATLDEALRTDNFAAFQVSLRNLVKSVGDSQIAAREVAAAGGDPSLIGGGVDYVSKIFTGTPSRDTMNKVRKTIEILHGIAARKMDREIATQKKIAAKTYSAEDTDLIFDGYGPIERASTPTPKAGTSNQTSKGTKYRIIE